MLSYTDHAHIRVAQRGVTEADVERVVRDRNFVGIHPVHGTRQYEGWTRGWRLNVSLDPFLDLVVTVYWL